MKDKLSVLIILLLIGSSYSLISFNSQELSFENSPNNFSFNSSNWTLSPTNGSHHGGTHLTINGDGFSSFFETPEINPWTTTTIDNNSYTGRWTSITTDNYNNIHISYQDSINYALKYATNSGGVWSYTTVDSNLGTGHPQSSIDVDSTGIIYISYSKTSYLMLAKSIDNGASWTTEILQYTTSNGEWNSLHIDSNDRIHISYYGPNGHLNYLFNGGTGWNSPVEVDGSASPIGTHTSITTDYQGCVHISYYDNYNTDLMYASSAEYNSNGTLSSNCGSSFTTDRVDNNGQIGMYTSIAVDSNFNVYISYQGNGLSVATINISTDIISRPWSKSIIDSEFTRDSSLGIDSNDFVHISYGSYDDPINSHIGALKYATYDGNSWNVSTIDHADVGEFSSLTIDSNANIHISYEDDANNTLKYAKLELINWTHTLIAGNNGDYSSMALDSNDDIHVSYYDSGNGDLVYQKFDGISWTGSVIDSTGNVGKHSSITIDSNDHIHISYWSGHGDDYLKYAKYDGVSWTISYLQITIGVSQSSISVDSNGIVHIAFCDMSCDDLYYGTYDSSFAPNSAWTSSIVENIGIIECRTSISLDIDSNEIPHIIYHHYNDQELKHASKNGGTWVTSTIDSFGFGIDPMESQFGCHNSLDIDSNDNLHVSYTNYNVDIGSLKYATYDGNSWTKSIIESMDTPIDSMYYSYADTSILLDLNGQVHISYHNLQLGELKYVTNDGNHWINSTIDGGSSIDSITDRDDDGHSTLALDSYGNLHVSYVDESNGIRYAKSLFQLENFWSISTVDDLGDVGRRSSIAIDSSENIHISYLDETNNSLKYANNINGIWNYYWIDGHIWPHINVGGESSIAIDSNDHIHISYHDQTNHDLKYAKFNGSWNLWVVDTSHGSGSYSSISVDSNGIPHIAYYSGGSADLRYAVFDNGTNSWNTFLIDDGSDPLTSNPGGQVGSNCEINIDLFGYIHIIYVASDVGLKYAKSLHPINGNWTNNWLIELIPSTTVMSIGSINSDSGGKIHFAFGSMTDLAYSNGTLHYATHHNGVWNISEIDNVTNSYITDLKISIDKLDIPHVAYERYHPTSVEIYQILATKNYNSWSLSTIGEYTTISSNIDLEIDSYGYAHISFGGMDTPHSLDFSLKYLKKHTGSSVLGDVTIEFGNYGNITGTIVDDTTIKFVSPQGPQSGAVVSNIKIWLENGSNITLPFSFTYDAYDSDGDGIPDNNDDCPYIFGNSTFDLIGCIDSDGDGYSDTGDAFPHEETQWADQDGDGYGDNISGNNHDAFPSDPTQWNDTDGDGCGDRPSHLGGSNADAFPLDATQCLDFDGDGYGDNQSGFQPDDCISIWGNSTNGRYGCPDADGDGLADMDDDFPNDPIRGGDSDEDGYDDAIDDDCPEEFGTSNMNLTGCLDSDGDGWADSEDDFPSDSTRNRDSDLDGYDDNLEDDCPDTWGTSNMNLVGCIDTDGDGLADSEDDFPLDASEIIDSDNDGFGNNEDRFPNDPNEWFDSDNDTYGDNRDDLPFDETQWNDTDGDGYGDNINGDNPDLFVNNITQWDDTDGDGYGDNWGNSSWNSTRLFVWPGQFIDHAELADHCPTESGNSTANGFFGCPDEDGDGIADIYDSPDEEEPVVTDEDGDGIIDELDLCPNTPSEDKNLVNEEGCVDLDSDGDGVVDKFDLCNDTPQGVEVNVEGCTIINSDSNEESENYMQQLLSGDQETVVATVGIGAVVIALIGFLQSNLVAAFLPDTLRGLQVLRKKSKLTREETQELTYLQSVLRAYHDDEDIFEEELKSYKSEITAKYTNNEIKKATLEKINLLVSDLLTMDSSELERIANDEAYFGLMGTTKNKERKINLSQNVAMKDQNNNKTNDVDETVYNKNYPPDSIKGDINENDGYEYIQWPKNSGRWFIKNSRTKQWEEWKD